MLKYLSHNAIGSSQNTTENEFWNGSDVGALFGIRCCMNSAAVSQAKLSITAEIIEERGPACGQ